MTKYFDNITTLDEAKKKFRELSKELHPDRPGGNSERFIEMQRQYTLILEAVKKHVEQEYSRKPNTKLESILNSIKNEIKYTGLEIGKKILDSGVVQSHFRNNASLSKSPYEKLINNGIANFLDHLK